MPRVTNKAAARGLGTAGGGHLSCKEEISRVQFPEVPFFRHGATGSADPLQG